MGNRQFAGAGEEDAPDERHDQRGDAAKDDRPRSAQQFADSPDSNPPSWLEAPINTFSTARTLPRIAGGVAKGTRVDRMKTLTASAAERANMATKASQYERAKPRTIVHAPKQATAMSKTRADPALDRADRDEQRRHPCA